MVDDKVLQQHMQGFTQVLIEGKLEPKELGFNESLRQGVYKHLDGITIDIYPSENRLSKTTTPSGGSLIGVNSSAFTVLASTTDQSLWAEVDAQINTILNTSIFIRADGTIPFTGNQSMGGQELNNVSKITGNSFDDIAVEVGNSGSIILDARDAGIIRNFVGEFDGVGFSVGTPSTEHLTVQTGGGGGTAVIKLGITGQDSFVNSIGRFGINNLSTSITASVTQTQGQQQLTKVMNEVGVVANANDVVTMPLQLDISGSPGGDHVYIKNNGANTLQVFPDLGGTFDGGALNASITIASGLGLLFWRVGARWITQ